MNGFPGWAIAAVLCAVVGVVLVIDGVVLWGAGKSRRVEGAVLPRVLLDPNRLVPSPTALVTATDDAVPGVTPIISGFMAPPDWVPVYPDSSKSPHGTRRDEKGTIKGITVIETGDPLDKVKDFYKSKLTDEGFELTVDKSMTRLYEHAEITGQKAGGIFTVRAIMHGTKERTVVNVSYSEQENAPAPSADNPTQAVPPNGTATGEAAGAAGSPKVMDPLPVWIPIYPAIKGRPHVTSAIGDGMTMGQLEFATTDTVAKVREFYAARLKEGGYAVETGVGPVQGAEDALLTGKKDGGRFSATVAVSASDGTTHVIIKFAGPV
jgi:hypothetical protein